MGRYSQLNWSVCLVTSYTSVFDGQLRLDVYYEVRKCVDLTDCWQTDQFASTHLTELNVFIITINTCEILLINLLCLQQCQSVSCPWRLENISNVTLRTALTSSARPIIFKKKTWMCTWELPKAWLRFRLNVLSVFFSTFIALSSCLVYTYY